LGAGGDPPPRPPGFPDRVSPKKKKKTRKKKRVGDKFSAEKKKQRGPRVVVKKKKTSAGDFRQKSLASRPRGQAEKQSSRQNYLKSGWKELFASLYEKSQTKKFVVDPGLSHQGGVGGGGGGGEHYPPKKQTTRAVSCIVLFSIRCRCLRWGWWGGVGVGGGAATTPSGGGGWWGGGGATLPPEPVTDKTPRGPTTSPFHASRNDRDCLFDGTPRGGGGGVGGAPTPSPTKPAATP